MKILFISSSLPTGRPSPIIDSQAKSLEKTGASVSFFLIHSKGLKGYIKEIFRLRKFLKKNTFDICHAHYGLSAIVATLARATPMVVSLMGSDVKEGGWQKWLIKRFVKHRWKATIAKSQELADIVGNKHCEVIPNGVNMARFIPMPQQQCRAQLNLDQNKTYILFAANPTRPEKNFALAKTAFETLSLEQTELIYLQNVPHGEIPMWMNAASVVVLSSLWEGSPNVIKEAMACNRPMVSTNVGDVKWLFGNTPGHFIANFDVVDFAQKMKEAIDFSNQYGATEGRERLLTLNLDSQSVAAKIISIYKNILHE